MKVALEWLQRIIQQKCGYSEIETKNLLEKIISTLDDKDEIGNNPS